MWTEPPLVLPCGGPIPAQANSARHVAKNAESTRARNLACRSWTRTGRPGVRACRVRRGGQGHRQFLAADRCGHKQDDQAAETKPPLGKLLADSGSEPGASAGPRFKEPAARTSQRSRQACSRVGWTIPATHAKTLASHRTPDPDVLVPRFSHSSVESGSLSFMR